MISNEIRYKDLTRREICDVARALQYTKQCPVCDGYGKWVSEANCYPLPNGVEDTPENQWYKHFLCHCTQCNGWGYVYENENCIHDWKWSKKLGNCLNLFTCVHCNKNWEIDSSD